jgi:serine/threonine protein kinase
VSTDIRRLGRYELQQRLGRGGMAEVWKALDTQLQRYVAIKILHADLQIDPDFIKRFEREARIVASLYHPNIVQVHDFQISYPPESDSTIAYMVMDYIEGQTLADYIHNTSAHGNFPPPADIVYLFTTLGRAIDYAHQQGMIHRDIKPANILLDKQFVKSTGSHTPLGEPILTDFGIVKLMSASTGSMSDSWLSTPLYIAPEQVQGHPGNESSDIYSLGVILYEICTGVLPFKGNNAPTIMMQHVHEHPIDPTQINAQISPALSQVILCALAKDPANRFRSASALADGLAAAFNLPVPDKLDSSTYMSNVLNTPRNTLSDFSIPVDDRSVSSPSLSVPVASTPTPVHTPALLSTIPPLPLPLKPRRKRRILFVALLALTLLILVSGFLGTLLLNSTHNVPVAPTPGGGYAFFVSSGQWNEGNNQGIEDKLQIALHNIPAPAAGKSYYAWLMGDKSVNNFIATKGVCTSVPHQTTYLYLGELPVQQGNVNFTYGGNQNTNLLTTYSRLLITEEDAHKIPDKPSTRQQDRRYYAELTQVFDKANQCLTELDYFRRLLSDGARLYVAGIRGGVDVQLLKNVQKVLEWSYSAWEAWGMQPAFIHRQMTRVLDYIDGTQFVTQDLPAGTPMLVDSRQAYEGLAKVSTIPLQMKRNYLSLIEAQLKQLIRAPGISQLTVTQVTQARKSLLNVQSWLSQVYRDAKLLFAMSNTQLAQPAALNLLDDLATQANYAFVGRLDPSTNVVQAGTIQIHYTIQQLPTFTIQPDTTN